MKEHAAAVMPDGLIREIHEDFHRAGNRHAVGVERVTFEPVMIRLGRFGTGRDVGEPVTVPGFTQV